mmetsp:Transcript_15139/g.28200  ORF Transcript_15139/g.28200 Transcript_15139/m.28200 type:complete len:114 (+) Transcript_15139:598-939(+)
MTPADNVRERMDGGKVDLNSREKFVVSPIAGGGMRSRDKSVELAGEFRDAERDVWTRSPHSYKNPVVWESPDYPEPHEVTLKNSLREVKYANWKKPNRGGEESPGPDEDNLSY